MFMPVTEIPLRQQGADESLPGSAFGLSQSISKTWMILSCNMGLEAHFCQLVASLGCAMEKGCGEAGAGGALGAGGMLPDAEGRGGLVCVRAPPRHRCLPAPRPGRISGARPAFSCLVEDNAARLFHPGNSLRDGDPPPSLRGGVCT